MLSTLLGGGSASPTNAADVIQKASVLADQARALAAKSDVAAESARKSQAAETERYTRAIAQLQALETLHVTESTNATTAADALDQIVANGFKPIEFVPIVDIASN